MTELTETQKMQIKALSQHFDEVLTKALNDDKVPPVEVLEVMAAGTGGLIAAIIHHVRKDVDVDSFREQVVDFAVKTMAESAEFHEGKYAEHKAETE